MNTIKRSILVFLYISAVLFIYLSRNKISNTDEEGCTYLTHLKIPATTTQVIVVRSPGGIKAQLTACEWNNKWRASLFNHSVPAVLGKNGLAVPEEKKEGDLKTPAGLYPIQWTFGTQPLTLQMDYRYITLEDKFIDDPKHPHYNTWITGHTSATSYESMAIPLYKMGAVINYNMNPIVAGAGSALFIHLWRSENQGTAGCVALSEPNLLQLLHWLEKKKNPYIYITSSTKLVQAE